MYVIMFMFHVWFAEEIKSNSLNCWKVRGEHVMDNLNI